MTNIKPLSDRLVVEMLKDNEQTVGGIYIPDSANRESTQQGIVLAVGKGKVNHNGVLEEMQVKVGDKVLISKYSGTDVKTSGKEVKILTEGEVLGIVED